MSRGADHSSPGVRGSGERRSLFELTDYDDLLRHLRTTFAAWPKQKLSKALGFRSPASASQFLSGRRRLSPKAITRLVPLLDLNETERGFLELLCRESTEPSVGRLVASVREPTHDTRQLSSEEFSVVSAWYHLPLFALLASSGRANLEWLSGKLRGKVSAAEILRSLAAWQKLGVVKRIGRRWQTEPATFLHYSARSRPSDHVRRFHREMIARALEAIEEQDMADRELGAVTFAMDPSRIPEAKAMLQRFREEFRRNFSDPSATEVCQLNLQFFWHTSLDGDR